MSRPTPTLSPPAGGMPTWATPLLMAAAIGGLALLALVTAPRAHAQSQEPPPAVSDTTALAAPAAPRLTLATYNSVLVEWDPPHDGGSPILRYSLTVLQGNGGGFSQDVGAVTEYLLTDLAWDTSYAVKVSAENALDRGGYSPTSRIRTPKDSSPDLPVVSDQTWRLGTAVDVVLPEAVGGNPPLSYSVDGLPDGLSFDAQTRRIDGAYNATQSTTVTYSVTDADGDIDSVTFDWTPRPSNLPPTVSIASASAVVDGGGSVVLDATANDPDNDPMTYSWTASPDLGAFTSTSTPGTTWTAPAAADNAKPITLTLTVSDGRGGSTATSVEVSMSDVARLEYAVEEMLGSLFEGNPLLTVEEKHPWLRQAWDYATHSGNYADMDYQFQLRTNNDDIPWVSWECHTSTSEPPLGQCVPTILTIPTFLLTDRYITGVYASMLHSMLAHELSHVFTLSSKISRDGIHEARPDLNAVAMLYFHEEYSCVEPPGELLADVLQVMVFPSSWGSYWYGCGYEYDMPEEAIGAVQSLLEGEYPDWFVDEYRLSEGGYALRQLWSDVVDSRNTIDVFYMQTWVWQLRNAFGSGYCSP